MDCFEKWDVNFWGLVCWLKLDTKHRVIEYSDWCAIQIFLVMGRMPTDLFIQNFQQHFN